MKTSILILIVITVASLVSCSYVRKLQKSRTSTSEVVEGKDNTSVQATVIDNLRTEQQNTVVKIRADSAYTRITTTRECFSDEFNLDNGGMKKTLPAPELIGHPSLGVGALRYREKIVKEIGTVQKYDKSHNIAISATRVEKAEQQASKLAQLQSRKTTENELQITVHRRRNSIAFLIILIIAVAGYVAYRYLGKKQ